MKKKILSGILAAALVFMTFGCNKGGGEDNKTPAESNEAAAPKESKDAETPSEENTGAVEGAIQSDKDFYAKADLSALKGKKIGITIQSLENAYWAGVMTALEEVLKANGAEPTIVSCKNNSNDQIGQVENFISSGCDLIMMHPNDAAALEDVAKSAMDKGIKVMCWDDPMTNTDANWILNNTVLGVEIGKLAGDFINKHYSEDNKAQVTVIGHPQTKVLLERANGIKQGLEESAKGKYEIVAEQAGIEANVAQTAMETILQKNPDCKVVAGVGAGAMIGANEALVTHVNGKVPEDMGVFTTDVTKQQLTQIIDGDQASKGIIGFEGSDVDTATACASMYALILQDKVGSHNVYRQTAPITIENAKKIMDEMK